MTFLFFKEFSLFLNYDKPVFLLIPYLFSVLYISIHKYLDGKEWPYLRESDYDHIGEGPGVGYNINIPINVVSWI